MPILNWPAVSTTFLAPMELKSTDIRQFQTQVWDYFAAHKRSMPWRQHLDPYWIMVSEMMLQQTQVDRVRPKFTAFVTTFPDIASLAQAPLSQVLGEWVGLGYNRRAKFLHSAAKEVHTQWNGTLPQTREALCSLPGIGPNTAGAILAYAYNQPVVFIETNVRSVLLHHFFKGQQAVTEKALLAVAAQVLATERPREWYWALMDYGSYLKKTQGNNIARARSYRKQSKFAGSLRQIRGKVIALLAVQPYQPQELKNAIADPRLDLVLAELSAEKLITTQGNRVQLAE